MSIDSSSEDWDVLRTRESGGSGLTMKDLQELYDKLNTDKQPAGHKYDDGKLDWTLIPFKQMDYVVDVLQTGLGKYPRDNWKNVANGKRRYLAAAYRHLNAVSDGVWLDEETKLPHLAHAICCLLFILWFNDNGKD